jgi:hypothetical protein
VATIVSAVRKTASASAPAASRSVRLGADRKVSATRAAEILNERHPQWHIDRKALGEALRAGRVPGNKIGRVNSFVLEELEPACAVRICPCPECERVALGESGGCERHGHVYLGAGAEGVARPDYVRAKIAKTKTGTKRTLDERAAMSRSRRRYAPERRSCEWCGDLLVQKRLRDEQIPLERLASIGLDLVPGSVIAKGGGRFCSRSHALMWAWTNDRGRFPQDGPGPDEFPCALCRRPLDRWPSQVANANAGGYRFI